MFFIIVLHNQSVSQKRLCTISGTIKNADTGELLPYVNVAILSLGRGDTSNEKGLFLIDKLNPRNYELTISYIGYLKQKINIAVYKNTNIKISLKPISTHLDELLVVSQRKSKNSTSSIINKEAIAHVQASSFSDILELLPGGLSRTNSLVGMNLASFREASGGTSNSSLGTAFVIDGMQLSNDAQLQTVVGASRSNSQYYRSNTTGKGLDMRMISTDDIESVELVTAAASIEYGDVTNALIKVKRVFRATPIDIRLKANPRGKLFSIAKGIKLTTNSSLNTNLAFTYHKPDPRNTNLSYSRITSSLRYKYLNAGKENPISIQTSFDFIESIDETKADSDIDVKGDLYKYSFRKYRFSSKFDWYNNSSLILKKITYTINSSFTSQKTIINKYVSSGGLRPMPLSFEVGVQDGFFLPSSYKSFLTIDGKPLLINSKLKFNLEIPTFGLKHNIIAGSEYKYDKNLGQGRTSNFSTPIFPSVRSSFARKSKDIPALNRLSFFFSDNLNLKIKNHEFDFMLGMRSASMMAMNSKYHIANKFYTDTRANLSWHLPKQYIGDDILKVNFIFSYANNTRFPTLSHLYPETRYFSKIQLNFYSTNTSYSKVNFKTTNHDATNYKIKPSRNEKQQVSLNLSFKKINLILAYFSEKTSSAFKYRNKYFVNNYTKYDASSVDVSSLSKAPVLSDFSSEERYYFETYSMIDNAGLTNKQGVEYSLSLGMIKKINSRITINGAWYKTKYDLTMAEYRQPALVVDNKTYPYMGVYYWDGGKTYQRFNTNLRVDTQVSSLGLIFTSLVQALWFTQSKTNYNNGRPTYYYDLQGKRYDYTAEDINDSNLVWLYKKSTPLTFVKDKVPLSIDVNLSLTKSLGSRASLSIYVNSILSYYSSYVTKYDFKIERSSFPRFGMELKLKI